MNPARSGAASFAAEERSVCRGWEWGSSDPRKSVILKKNGPAAMGICGYEEEETGVWGKVMYRGVWDLYSSALSRLRLWLANPYSFVGLLLLLLLSVPLSSCLPRNLHSWPRGYRNRTLEI